MKFIVKPSRIALLCVLISLPLFVYTQLYLTPTLTVSSPITIIDDPTKNTVTFSPPTGKLTSPPPLGTSKPKGRNIDTPCRSRSIDNELIPNSNQPPEYDDDENVFNYTAAKALLDVSILSETLPS
eukprot:PhF_6_TR6192/c4_g1_i3/m.9302